MIGPLEKEQRKRMWLIGSLRECRIYLPMLRLVVKQLIFFFSPASK